MMKKLLLFFFFSAIQSINAQSYDEIIFENSNYFLMFENEKVLITTNGNDTFFSGFLGFKSNSEGSVTIKPEVGHVISIVPMTQGNLKTLGAGTQVGGRPPIGIGGGIQPKITVYPNPAISMIQLQSTENIIGYKVYDSQGTQRIANSLLKSKQFSVNVSNLSSGIYHTTILLENGQSISKQFIKQ